MNIFHNINIFWNKSEPQNLNIAYRWDVKQTLCEKGKVTE